MRSMLARAVNPTISLLDGLRNWNDIARALRARQRRRQYQNDRSWQFLS